MSLASSVSCVDIGADAVDQRVSQPLVDRLLAPGEIDLALLRLAAFVALGRFEQAVGRVGAPVEDHVLDQLAQLGIDIVVERKLAGIDDAHVHAGLDGVIEEHRMHRLAHPLIAAKGEGEVRHAARHMHVRQLGLDAARGIDIGAGVVVMLLDAGGDGEDVRIEDDVLGREADLLGQEIVGALADLEFALGRFRLALLVEGHDHDGGAVAADFARMLEERPLAFLQADGIDHRLALHAFQPGLDHRPFRGIDHDRHAGDVGLGRDQIEEGDHRLLGVEHALVHVDVEHVGAALDLLARDFERGGIVVRLDQLAEARGAGDIGPLAHHDEILRAVGHVDLPMHEGFEAGEAELVGDLGHVPRLDICDGRGDGADVVRRRAAAAADDVDQTVLRPAFEQARHEFGALVILAHLVGKTGIGIDADIRVGDMRDLIDRRPELLGAEGAIEPDRERLEMLHRVPEGLRGLAREIAPGEIGDGAGDHDGKLDAQFVEHLLDGEARRLGVQRVEHRLDEDDVGAAFDQAARLDGCRPRPAHRS